MNKDVVDDMDDDVAGDVDGDVYDDFDDNNEMMSGDDICWRRLMT